MRIERFLARRGYGQDDDDRGRGGDDEAATDDAQLMLQEHSLTAAVKREADGLPAPVRRHQVIGGRRRELPPLCAICDGYNLHAGVHLAVHARAALERLCRYTLRGPLPKGRLEQRPDGKLLLRLKRPWSDGSTALLFEPLELLARLAALLPRPGKNGISYHGVLGARAALRAGSAPIWTSAASFGGLRCSARSERAVVSPCGAPREALRGAGSLPGLDDKRGAKHTLTPRFPCTSS